LEVDKTKIKYLDVEIGKVTAITIRHDLKTIEVTAQMNQDTDDYLTRNTKFWVVKPQVGLGGVSGLSTLVSGAYIAINPEKGDSEHHFVGLPVAPTLKINTAGKQFILETMNVGSMRAGTPINFHGITVGEILNYELAKNADGIRLTVFINAPYDQFIRKNTRFWIDSGVDLSANAEGFKVRTGPLISLLSGGIAFRTDPNDKATDNLPENSAFQLFDSYEQSTQAVYQKTVKLVMYFSGSVRGLTIGAPVSLRGIPIGKVTEIDLEVDEKTAEIRIPIEAEIDIDRIKKINKQEHLTVEENVANLISEGLRAQLQTGNLLTGQLFIALDMFPKSKVVIHHNDRGHLEFPTMPNSLDQITHSAQAIMDKISKLPLETMSAEITKTLQSLQSTSKAVDSTLVSVKSTLGATETTLKTTDKTMNSAHKVLSTFEPGTTTQYELNRLLQELTQTASSVKQLTDYLEQHPESLLRGKEEKK
jgi:paraquat-inducible protein B